MTIIIIFAIGYIYTKPENNILVFQYITYFIITQATVSLASIILCLLRM